MRLLKHVLLATVLLCVALFVGACGGNHAPTPLVGHPCKANDAYMQCVLPKPPAGLKLPQAGNPVARGIDFAWGGPSCATLKANGWSFGASYLSYDNSKNWSHAQFADYMRNGCKAVFVWETGASRATNGYNAGYSDAVNALAQYRSFVPNGRVAITFAIDCDCSIGQVRSYFQGADAYLWPRAGRNSVNAYGGYYPVTALCREHLVGSLNWPTYAWSGGNWPAASCGPLQQWLNGNSYDNDRAIATDYGQWPPPAPPPPVDPHHYLISPASSKSLPDGRRGGPFASPFGRLDERLVRLQYAGAYGQRKYAAYVKNVLRPELGWLAARISALACFDHDHAAQSQFVPCDYKPNDWGARFQILIHAAQGQRP